MIKLDNVSKFYKTENGVAVGVQKVNLEFHKGEFVALVGESGSGKSTLLNVMSGIDGYEEGEMYINGEETSHFSIQDWERYRSANIGFVFQSYNIIDSYTVLQNVMIALEVQGYPADKIKERAYELIEKVGLTSHRNHKASKLSGGQKQRAVIARALAKDAPIIMADEPTGNIDSKSGEDVMKLLHDISKDKLVIVVTHNYEQLEKYATRRIKMSDGQVYEDKQLKKIEHKDSVTTVESKKMKRTTVSKFAFRNIFATPKKLAFSVIVQTFMIFLILMVFATQLQSIRSVSGSDGTDFSNNKITVRTINNSSLTNSQFDYLKNIENVKLVSKYADFINRSYSFLYEDSYTESYYINGKLVENDVVYTNEVVAIASSIYDSRQVEGNLPSNINEAILLGGEDSGIKVGDSYDFYLATSKYIYGDEGVLNDDDTTYAKKLTFKIVGKLKGEAENLYNNIGLGLHDDMFNNYEFDYYSNTNNGVFSIQYNFVNKETSEVQGSSTHIYSNNKARMNIIPTNKLNGNEISFYNSQMIYYPYGTVNMQLLEANFGKNHIFGANDITIVPFFETFYPELVEPMKEPYATPESLGITQSTRLHTTSDLGYISNFKFFTYSPNVVYVSDEIYQQLMNIEKQNVSTATLFVDEVKDGKSVAGEIINGKFKKDFLVKYSPMEKTFMSVLEELFANISTVLIMIAITSFSYAIISWTQKSVMNTRRRDFAIFRSIGADKSTLSKLVVIEQSFITLICYFFVIVGVNISRLFSLKMDIYFSNISLLMHLIMFSVIILYSIRMGKRFNKKIFNETVIKTLG